VGQNTTQDDLDRLLSWGLHELVRAAKPPVYVWQQIERKLRAGPSPVRRRLGHSAWRTAPLVQALALASLLVLIGLSLGPGFQWSSYFYRTGEQVEMLTRTPVVRQAEGVPLTGEEGLLSGRDTLLLAREQAYERQVMARDTSPGADPILTHRHEWQMFDKAP